MSKSMGGIGPVGSERGQAAPQTKDGHKIVAMPGP